MPKYFECKPNVLCKGAYCCTSIDTQPELTLGDFFRLSSFTHEPIVDIWRNKGNISLSQMPNHPQGIYAISLGLQHSPCPYLSEDYRCTIHNSRPLTCAGFPVFNASGKMGHKIEEAELANYQCLKDIVMKQRQSILGKELYLILQAETFLEIEHLWNGTIKGVEFRTCQDYFDWIKQALKLQKERDSQLRSRKSLRLLQSAKTIVDLVEKDSIIDDMVVKHHLKYVVYAVREDEIAEMLANAEKFKPYYEETTRRFREIIGQIN